MTDAKLQIASPRLSASVVNAARARYPELSYLTDNNFVELALTYMLIVADGPVPTIEEALIKSRSLSDCEQESW